MAGTEMAVKPMDMIDISKALSNETRLNILRWLKEPYENFPPQGGSLGTPVDLKGCMRQQHSGKSGGIPLDDLQLSEYAAGRGSAHLRAI